MNVFAALPESAVVASKQAWKNIAQISAVVKLFLKELASRKLLGERNVIPLWRDLVSGWHRA